MKETKRGDKNRGTTTKKGKPNQQKTRLRKGENEGKKILANGVTVTNRNNENEEIKM